MTEFVKRTDGFQIWMEYWADFDYAANDPPFDTLLPINELNVCGVHGTGWRETGSTDSRAVVSTQSLIKLNDQYNKRGIELVPHNIPKGVDIPLEVSLAKQMLAAVPKLVIDFEASRVDDEDCNSAVVPSEFWSVPFSEIQSYIEPIREAYPNAWIATILNQNCPEIYEQYWSQYVDAVYMGINVGPLSNYGATSNPNMDPIPLIIEARDVAAQYAPNKEWWSIMDPTDPVPQRFELSLKYVEMYGMNISVWRRGIVLDANWDVLRNHKKNVWT